MNKYPAIEGYVDVVANSFVLPDNIIVSFLRAGEEVGIVISVQRNVEYGVVVLEHVLSAITVMYVPVYYHYSIKQAI